MKFFIKNTGENIVNVMRKIGYYFQAENQFIRPLERSGYPRFHLYIKTNKELIFNLHLDQKKPIYPVRSPSRNDRDGRRLWRLTSNGVYKGAPAHSGEYDGEVVEKEAERIKQILK